MSAGSILTALLIGIMFGLALQKGGLTRYRKIIGVFRFTDMTVIKFMLTGILVSMAGLYLLRGLGLIQFPAAPATYLVGNLIGGLIFGIGMALTGY